MELPRLPDIERKWQEHWRKTHAHSFDVHRVDEAQKCYCLAMFPYPSGEHLHVGHWFNFAPADTWARFQKMRGLQVFQPMGFDAFGLPAEQHAIKTGTPPRRFTLDNIETMEEQLWRIGAMYDWDYEIVTCEPDYYRWTQWLFLKLFEQGLAYQRAAPVNWCHCCHRTLADEEVAAGLCVHCDGAVEIKKLRQWFFRITDYADELLSGLADLDWPENTKARQRNWIGRSAGGEIVFRIVDSQLSVRVFTAKPEELFGAVAIVLAPEHPSLDVLCHPDQLEQVTAYRAAVSTLSNRERSSLSRPKTGVFTGRYATNPLTNEQLPVYVADYVLPWYATGCAAAVPAIDDRDRAFARACGLSNRQFQIPAHAQEIYDRLAERGEAWPAVHYRLRDWLVSRQRYWGTPIPIVHCPQCGAIPVPEDDLPLLLPEDVHFAPRKPSPLTTCQEFLDTECPQCRGRATRETDTLDTFVCSAWYFLRLPCANNHEEPFTTDIVNRLLPVDKYVGGSEHACLHLLYARFITKALADSGYLGFREPFWSLSHQGPIRGRNGRRMTKRNGNVVSPEPYLEQYGSDVLRLHLMFTFAFTVGGRWQDHGLKAIERWFKRLWRWFDSERILFDQHRSPEANPPHGAPEQTLRHKLHDTIKRVTIDTASCKFNTAISRLMELTSALYQYRRARPLDHGDYHLLRESSEDLIRLLAPYAPHLAEELWQQTGHERSIFHEHWPEYDEAALRPTDQLLVVHVNGIKRGQLVVSIDAERAEIEERAAALDAVAQSTKRGRIVRTVYIPRKLLNFVVS